MLSILIACGVGGSSSENEIAESIPEKVSNLEIIDSYITLTVEVDEIHFELSSVDRIYS